MRGWWQEISSLVLPTRCAGCGGPRGVVCARCREALAAGPAGRVRTVVRPAGLPPVYAACDYADEARALLLAHKERGALTLAGPLGAALAVSAGRALGDARGFLAGGRQLYVVPVPSAPAAVARRGHDPVRRMALAAAGRLRREGFPASALALLRQCRPVVDQVGLGAGARLANLSGAHRARPGLLPAGGLVLLVDDVVTTGASLAEAARAVRASGGRPLAAAVVAAPVRGRDERTHE